MFDEVVKSVIEELSNSSLITIYKIKIDTQPSDLATTNIMEFRKYINQDKFNLILDIDGTIVDSNMGDYLIVRPYCEYLFKFCMDHDILIFLWTCGELEHAYRVIDAINGSKYLTKVLCRGDSWYNNAYTVKKLKWLSRNIDNLLLVDNTIFMSNGQNGNTIIVPTFETINIWSYKLNRDSLFDDQLVKLIEFLKGFMKSEQNITEYLNSHLKMTIDQTLKYYTLS